MSTIAQRLHQITQRVEAACRRCGRQPGSVVILAATKTRTPEELLQAAAAGLTHFGENYVQELLAKRQAIDKAGFANVSWHMIGHLQRNKVKYLVPGVTLIHSLDSVALAEEIEKRAARAGIRQPVLLEVNLAAEATKSGVAPEGLPALAERVLELPHLDLQGLMAMPPYSEDPEDSRPYFQALRGLADSLRAQGIPAENLRHLSMGMSGDYEVAVEEGATIIRLGTALFGPRP